MVERARSWFGWALLPVVVALQFCNFHSSLTGEVWLWSQFLWGFAGLSVMAALLLWPRRRELRSSVGVMAACFTATIAYALVSAVVTPPPYVTGRLTHPPRQWVVVPVAYRVVPLVTAWFTMVAALGVALAMPRRQRLARLWWCSLVLVVTSFLAWPRAAAVQGSPRLATAMGGASTLHVVLLLCAAVLVGAVVQGHRRWVSGVGAGLAVLALLLTGSRAGLIALGTFAAALALWFLGRVSVRLVLGLMAGGAATMGLFLTFFPVMRRVLNFEDESRLANARAAGEILGLGWRQVVFGAGAHRVWPWYPFEANYLEMPWRGIASSPFGPMLTNPHSVPLGVLVELGLVGLALLVGVGLVPVVLLRRRWRHWRRTASPVGAVSDLALLAVVVSMVTFAFDHYLFKNFAVSFWWWVVVSSVLLDAAPDWRRERVHCAQHSDRRSASR